ncbi:riboflavin synthase subunit alpha [Motiliproteus coralliicola]|uniref:Riboflavin synthase n=1 Tax=Motiliproteus coralliicola TaxID=2283196 RepID=A0A369WVC3_9GAMM|nr:riboflavin synthase subunit alpha [Motiliproteus coralliicola]RDE24486.1 riboflavin synthase subunit alpha [Motiliproteus coralliicola]
MFTGIVHGTAEVVAIDKRQDFQTHTLVLDSVMRDGLSIGASVAHNGCCLTVTRIDGEQVSFDLMQATLNLTNLGSVSVGDRVNVERAARFGDEIGGHSMSGHIICTAVISQIIDSPNNRQVWFELPAHLSKYLFTKGYIGIDGISLTIGEVDQNRFCVNLIPETLARTNLGVRQQGEMVNIEVDPQTQAIVDTVERVLASQQG